MTTAQAMFSPFSAEEIANAKPIAASTTSTEAPIIPVPEDAPPCTFRHPVHGEPTGRWPWHDAAGRLIGYTYRFDFERDGKHDKEFLPVTFCTITEGDRTYRAWRAKGIPAPRPLYRLPQLLAETAKPIIFTEGEKKADRALELFPDFASTTTMGGANAPHRTDFSPVAGKPVVIWPDHDRKGRSYAIEVAKRALEAGALDVAIVEVPANFPHKWDLADRPPEGVTNDDLKFLLECAVPFRTEKEEPITTLPDGFRMTPSGLMGRPAKAAAEADESSWIFIAEPFEVVAEIRDHNSCSWGVLLRWRDGDGRVHEIILQRSALAGDGLEARRILLDGGLRISNTRRARDLLNEFLLAVRSSGRARFTDRIGWHGDTFVLPDQCFGPARDDRVVVRGDMAFKHAFKTRGSLEDWNRDIARLARGNSRLLSCISAAFAAPLIGPCSLESGGLHLTGPSSCGKTTALRVAGSVCGGGEPNGYLKSWRATANGLEGIARDHSDMPLCLDEISQVSSKDAGEVAYTFGNGSGKQRADREGNARPTHTWRSFLLSSGEVSLADKIAEDGRGRRATAGQQVRINDLLADAGAGLGIFEELHEFPTAEKFARHLREAADRSYGTAIRAFLAKISCDMEAVCAAIKKQIQHFVRVHVPEGADGQVYRVAQRFGLIAAAGEMAVAAGVISTWEPGDAIAGAARCFNDWLTERGGVEPAELRDGIAQVHAFLSAHGEARFAAAWDGKEDTRIPVRDLVGYRRQTDEGWEFYITTSAWKDEVCKGLNAKTIATEMVRRGFIEGGAKGRTTRALTVPDVGKRRLYHVRARFLEGDDS